MSADDIDLVDLNSTKNWLGMDQKNTDPDTLLQFLITAMSQYVINFTGVASFNQVVAYTGDIYDGNGHARIFLRNVPILTVTTVQVGSFQIPQSTSVTTNGWYIEPAQRSIALRNSPNVLSPPTSIYPYYFIRGQGNIAITYTAGYTEVPYDLAVAVMRAVGIVYTRKSYQDLASQSLSTGSGSGTTTYRNWALPPDVMDVFVYYKRRALV